MIPTGGLPAAKASSIALASAGFLFLARAEAHAGPRVFLAMSRMRPLLMRDHSMSAVGRTWPAKSMSSRAMVASSSGRAWGSKANWPFTVRATEAANNACLSASGNARSAANDSPSSSMASQSQRQVGAVGEQRLARAPGAEILVVHAHGRPVGGLPDRDVERMSPVATGEHGAAELEQHEIEGGLEVVPEMRLDQCRADRAEIVRKPDPDTGLLARLGLRIGRRGDGGGDCGSLETARPRWRRRHRHHRHHRLALSPESAGFGMSSERTSPSDDLEVRRSSRSWRWSRRSHSPPPGRSHGPRSPH